jgi:hypothetical protein
MMACIVNNNSTPIERHGLHYLISGVSGQSQRQPRPLGRLTPGVSVRRLQAAGERPRRPRSWRAHLEEPWSGGQTKPIDDEEVHRPTRSPPAGPTPTVRRGERETLHLHAPARCGKPETFRGRKACAHEGSPVQCSAPATLHRERIGGAGGRRSRGDRSSRSGNRCDKMLDRRVYSTAGKIYGANVFAGIDGQMGQARWASTGTARKSTTLARHGHDTIVLVPARGTIYIVPGPQVRPAALARARHD